MKHLFQMSGDRQRRAVIFERGETNEVNSAIVPAFYSEMFSKAVAQVGKLSKECSWEGRVSTWLEFVGHITWEEGVIYRKSSKILHGVHLAFWLIANLWMLRAKFYHARQRTTSDERILSKICKPNNTQSSYKSKNHSSFHHPKWRVHIKYIGHSIETPYKVKP